MLNLIAPLFDWEDAEHAAGALGTLVEIGLSIWNSKRDREEDDEEESSNDMVVKKEDGSSVPLGAVLQGHEERLAALEAKSKPRRRRKAAR
jgi:hypothetical protein